MSVSVQREDFDVGAEMARMRGARTDIGALACFVGTVRELAGDASLDSMTLEHYPGMTEKALGLIIDEARSRWDLLDVRVIHRIGELGPGQQIVMVIVASAHRADAFLACEFIMDYLKTRAPFWKKERGTGGDEHWVEARASDDAAARRW